MRAAFPPATFERGSRYAEGGNVQKTARDGDTITAEVRGTGRTPYQVRVDVSKTRTGLRFRGTCTCPVQHQCKHVVAVLLDCAEAAEPAGAAVDPVTAEWMTRLIGAARVARRPAGDSPKLFFRLAVDESRPSPVLCVHVAAARVRKDGGIHGAVPVNAAVPPGPDASPEDARILHELHLACPSCLATEGYPLHGAGVGSLLRRLIETDRCVFENLASPPLRLGKARPARLEWILGPDATQRPRVLTKGAARVLPTVTPWYVDMEKGTCGPLATGLDDTVVAALLQAPPLSPSAARELRRLLISSSPEMAELLPREIATGDPLTVRPLPCLLLSRESVRARRHGHHRQFPDREVDVARLSFAYDGLHVLPSDPREEVATMASGQPVVYARAFEVEEESAARLARAGLTRLRDLNLFDLDDSQMDDHAAEWLSGSGGATLSFVLDQVPKLRAEGWQVDIAPDFPVQEAQDVGEWYGVVDDTSGIDWFGLELGVMVGGQKVNVLPLLLDVLHRFPDALSPRALAELDDGAAVTLPMADRRLLPVPVKRLRAILAALADLYDVPAMGADGRLRLSKLRAVDLLELDETLGTDVRWKGGETARTFGRRLRDFQGIRPVPLPSGLIAELRPYQTLGLDWLQFLREYDLAGILADDMGLGKTVQALTHILAEKESGRMDCPSLVVCPTSLVTTWRREAARFTPTLSVLALHGPGRQTDFSRIDRSDLVITTYPLLPRDRTILLGRQFHCVVLDEAQMVKNPASQAGQVARRLTARQRLCLTGTPMENHLGELWSLFDFLLPGFLGDEAWFRRFFRTPIEKRGDETRRAVLARRVRPFLLRRTKEQVAADLPPKTEILQGVELDGPQRDLYEAIRLSMHARIREEIAERGLARSRITILDALLKLRQVCCDPRLLKTASGRKGVSSAKLRSLMDMLPNLVDEGRRVLLFSQFTEMLGLIEAEVTRAEIPFVKLTGQTRDRTTPVDRFQAGEIPLFLISLKAGGTGLNLTAADTVIHYDPWWNPAVEAQATDRAHRIGQNKAVFVYKMVAVGTVEEKMMELQERKRALANGVYGGSADEAAQLSPEDLEALFAPLE